MTENEGNLISREALKQDFKERNIWNQEIASAIDNAPTVANCLECAKEHEQLAEWLKELKDLRAFAKWVRGEVLDDYFEESSGAFAEIACRKLTKLGYTEVDGGVYKKKEGEE